jgi:hypothetical protein
MNNAAAKDQTTHARGFWAPSADRRLKAVRSELNTMAELREARGLTVSEQRYLEHLRRRETELTADAEAEIAKAAELERSRPF